jgi:hypothetical protein
MNSAPADSFSISSLYHDDVGSFYRQILHHFGTSSEWLKCPACAGVHSCTSVGKAHERSDDVGILYRHFTSFWYSCEVRREYQRGRSPRAKRWCMNLAGQSLHHPGTPVNPARAGQFNHSQLVPGWCMTCGQSELTSSWYSCEPRREPDTSPF